MVKQIKSVFDPRFLLREQQAHGTQFSIESLRPRQGLLCVFVIRQQEDTIPDDDRLTYIIEEIIWVWLGVVAAQL
jgi:hypothetical protein